MHQEDDQDVQDKGYQVSPASFFRIQKVQNHRPTTFQCVLRYVTCISNDVTIKNSPVQGSVLFLDDLHKFLRSSLSLRSSGVFCDVSEKVNDCVWRDSQVHQFPEREECPVVHLDPALVVESQDPELFRCQEALESDVPGTGFRLGTGPLETRGIHGRSTGTIVRRPGADGICSSNSLSNLSFDAERGWGLYKM